ncbi:MAG: membrane dipeptidase [Gammaproteobacteria bacterium]|nr:membrane dipeptidase [Gammaproteobacteria bacterium]
MNVDKLHQDALIMDGLVFYSDHYAKNLLAAHINAVNLTVSHFEADFETACDQIAAWRTVALTPESDWHIVNDVSDIDSARQTNKIGLIMGWQNMRPIGDNLDRIEFFHRLGIRIMQPTYNYRNFMGDGCLEKNNGGLSRLGTDAIRIMNELGIAVDLSHVGERTSQMAVEASAKPVLITHANSKTVVNIPRNKSDNLIKAVAEKGGVIGTSIYCTMCWNSDPKRRPAISDYIAQLEHIVELVGVEHIAIGTDLPAVSHLDKVSHITEMTLNRFPAAVVDYVQAFGNDIKTRYLSDCSSHTELVHVTSALLERGWTEGQVRGLLGENLHRTLSTIWAN